MKTNKEKNKLLEKKVNTRYTTFLDDINFGRMEFLDGAAERMSRLKSSGLSDNAIVEAMYKEMLSKDGGTLAKLENKEANCLWDFMKGASQDTVFSDLDDEKMYKWVMNPGAKHCEGCSERNGQIKTLDEWYDIGVPGSGDTDCYYNCMCDLVPVEEPFSRIKGRDMKDLDAHKQQLDNWKKEIANASNKLSQNKKDFIKLENTEQYPDKFPITKTEKGEVEQIPAITSEFFTGYINKLAPDIKVDIQVDIAGIHYKQGYLGLREIKKQIGEKYLKNGIPEISIRKKVPSPKNKTYVGVSSDKGIIIGSTPYEVTNSMPDYQFSHILLHEIGHRMYRSNSLVTKIVNEFYTKNKNDIVKYYESIKETDSAIENASEFFAETFARYIGGIIDIGGTIKADGTNPYEKELFEFMKETAKTLKEN